MMNTCGIGLLCFVAAFGASPKPAVLVENGNKAFTEGRYAEAATQYEAALRERPKSPVITFDLANARFKQGQIDDARKLYLEVFDHPESGQALRRRTLYNLGNAAFHDAEQKLADGDLAGAVASYRDSVQLYQGAAGETRRLDDALAEDALWNVQVTRLRMKKILDELKRRQEQQQERDEKNRRFREKLDKAIAEQEAIAVQTEQPDTSAAQRDELQAKQHENLERTKELAQELADTIEQAEEQASQFAEAQVALENMRDAQAGLDEGQAHEAETAEHVRNEAMERARQSAEKAVENLKRAREALSQEQQQQQAADDQQQSAGGAAEGQDDRHSDQGKNQKQRTQGRRLTKEEAQRLLEELKRNQARARLERMHELERRGYRPFDKQQYEKVLRDW